MSNDLNMVSITGHICAAPELKFINDGTAVANFSIANNVYKPSAEDKSYANFFDVVIFGNRAEALGKILTKGMLIALQGRLQQDRWENKEGQKRSKIKIIASEIKLMANKGGSGGDGESNYKKSTGFSNGFSDPTPENASSEDAEIAAIMNNDVKDDVKDSDVPF